MSEKETGGPAFGTVISLDCVRVEIDGSAEYEPTVQPGNLTVRDYAAFKALQGFCANPAVCAANGMSGWGLVNCTEEQLSDYAYFLADAMLKARKP
jgi:hypothetical protein